MQGSWGEMDLDMSCECHGLPAIGTYIKTVEFLWSN